MKRHTSSRNTVVNTKRKCQHVLSCCLYKVGRREVPDIGVLFLFCTLSIFDFFGSIHIKLTGFKWTILRHSTHSQCCTITTSKFWDILITPKRKTCIYEAIPPPTHIPMKVFNFYKRPFNTKALFNIILRYHFTLQGDKRQHIIYSIIQQLSARYNISEKSLLGHQISHLGMWKDSLGKRPMRRHIFSWAHWPERNIKLVLTGHQWSAMIQELRNALQLNAQEEEMNLLKTELTPAAVSLSSFAKHPFPCLLPHPWLAWWQLTRQTLSLTAKNLSSCHPPHDQGDQ